MIEESLRELVREAVSKSGGGFGLPEIPLDVEIEIDVPRKKEFGDFSTNIALVLARRLDRSPREVAEALVAAMPAGGVLEREPQIAGPGFVNFFVTDDWLHTLLRRVARDGSAYGRAEPVGERVQVEFVSANPTGPLHIGHARNAAVGDALARLLEASGRTVEREYYFNDAGGQMDRFGASVEARYLQLLGREGEVPEDGYHGEYLVDVARDIIDEYGDRLVDLPQPARFERLRAEGARRVLDGIEATLERFGVRFDSYRSERELAESGKIDDAVERLRSAGYVFETDGAVWFRSTAFGDDKDRVLIRSNGAHTYFAADCAYVVDKFDRGFDHVIYVWGADHHGGVKRVTGAAQAMGFAAEAVEMVLYQFVAFLRGGEPVKMSKRAGTFVSLDELIDEVGADAARFTLLSQSNDSAMNFDIEVVRRQSMENPVYYVQYGHARIASILRTAAERGIELRSIADVDLSVLKERAELDLLRALAEFPPLVAGAAAQRAPYKLTHYAQDLAGRFHRFYTDCRVLSDDDRLTQSRLWVCSGTKQVLANVLGLLGVSAPESMKRDPGEAEAMEFDDAG
jgi:arginyl-tRNA synthetase